MTYLLIIVYDISKVVSTGVVCFAHRHGVVCEVDIAVIAEVLRHLVDLRGAREKLRG